MEGTYRRFLSSVLTRAARVRLIDTRGWVIRHVYRVQNPHARARARHRGVRFPARAEAHEKLLNHRPDETGERGCRRARYCGMPRGFDASSGMLCLRIYMLVLEWTILLAVSLF